MVYVISLIITFVLSEGYYCPYVDLGSSVNSELLYDYYNSNGDYWTRIGETGWMSTIDYCKNKGDVTLHSDAGEWKCNDSHLLCYWNGSSCEVNTDRKPDCKKLCQAVLDNMGPECLGNCPNGHSSNNLYSTYCEPSITSQSNQTHHNQHNNQHNNHNQHNNNHNQHNSNNYKHKKRCRR